MGGMKPVGDERSEAAGTGRLGLSRNVRVLGWVSFFNDVASEMLYPIVPIFLTTVLQAPASVVGLIEGIAESTSSVLKLASGWLSDRLGARKPFVVLGYFLSTASRIILGLAATWRVVLAARFVDRFGKGARTSARDALIAESSHESARGRAFGYHRAVDTLGAVVGPLAAILLIRLLDNDFKTIFFISAAPGLVGVALLIFLVRESKPRRRPQTPESPPSIAADSLSTRFKVFLLISAVFAVGNSSDAFLILRAQSLGMSLITTILAYTVFNLSYALLSFPAGAFSDRVGARRVMISGFLIFGIVYFLFGLVDSSPFLWILFPLYGGYMALTEGVGKAYMSRLVSGDRLGKAMGIYQMVMGLCMFFASVIAGLLWTHLSVRAPFFLGAATAILAAVIFALTGRHSANRRE